MICCAAIYLASGLIVSTHPSSASISSSAALSAWNFYKSANLFAHGTPLVTKYCLSGGKFLLLKLLSPVSHLHKEFIWLKDI